MKCYPICDECVAGIGACCHNPECAYCRSDTPPKMPWPEFGIDGYQAIRERDEALEILREWLELYEEDIADQSYMGPLNRTKAILAKHGAKP